MRKDVNAPVDYMGCDKSVDLNEPPKVCSKHLLDLYKLLFILNGLRWIYNFYYNVIVRNVLNFNRLTVTYINRAPFKICFRI